MSGGDNTEAMQRTTFSSLFVVVLVAFAGCNAFSSGSNTPMVTPMDVPTDEPIPTLTPGNIHHLPKQCTPGLTQIGFANTAALSAAHNRTLQNSSFTASYTSTGIYRNGSIVSHTDRTVRVAENYSRIRLVSEWFGSRSNTSPRRFELWKNHSRVVTRRSSGHTAHYEVRPFPPGERGHFRSLARYYITFPKALLGNATVCVIDQFTHDGTTLAVIAFTRSKPPYRLRPNTIVIRNISGRAIVSSSGIVYELRWDYTVQTGDGTVIIYTSSIYYTDIGSTTAERPLWYEKAVNQTRTANRTRAKAKVNGKRISS